MAECYNQCQQINDGRNPTHRPDHNNDCDKKMNDKDADHILSMRVTILREATPEIEMWISLLIKNRRVRTLLSKLKLAIQMYPFLIKWKVVQSYIICSNCNMHFAVKHIVVVSYLFFQPTENSMTSIGKVTFFFLYK